MEVLLREEAIPTVQVPVLGWMGVSICVMDYRVAVPSCVRESVCKRGVGLSEQIGMRGSEEVCWILGDLSSFTETMTCGMRRTMCQV